MEQSVMTLYQDIAQYSKSTNIAIYFRNEKIRYVDLLNRVNILADHFYSLGIHRDSVVSLLSYNCPEAIIALYALNKIGAIVSILHPLIPVKGLSDSIKDTKSEYLIILDARYSAYKEELKGLNIQTYFITALVDLSFFEKGGYKKKYFTELSDVDQSKVLTSTDKKFKFVSEIEINNDPQKVSFYLRSGGTTNHIKTVALNDKAIRYAGSRAGDILSRDFIGLSTLGVLPIFHGFGLSMGIHAPLMHNASIYLMMKFDGDEIATAINKKQLNLLLAVPYMINRLMQNPKFRSSNLSNLYMTFVGADKISETLVTEFNELMKKHGSQNRIYEGYGQTEIVTVGFVNTINDHRMGSVGKPLDGLRVKIVNPEDRRKELPVGEDGEILITGPSNCLGYLNTPKNRQPFFTDAKKITYIGTGDIGHVDEDGYLYFKNRYNDVVKIAGFNVYLADIENLADEIDGVVDAAAIYVSKEEHPYIHLYVENHSKDDKLLKEELLNHLKAHLIKYSLPEKVSILPHFPRTSVGKIDKKALIHF
jgi:long-chain acyl-CoA synthetase